MDSSRLGPALLHLLQVGLGQVFQLFVEGVTDSTGVLDDSDPQGGQQVVGGVGVGVDTTVESDGGVLTEG